MEIPQTPEGLHPWRFRRLAGWRARLPPQLFVDGFRKELFERNAALRGKGLCLSKQQIGDFDGRLHSRHFPINMVGNRVIVIRPVVYLKRAGISVGE